MSRIEGIEYDAELTRIRESIAEKQDAYVKEHSDLTGTEECNN